MSAALRPLPPRPSLEYEHKEAKALHRRLRAGDPDALERARVQHPTIDMAPAEKIQLADAQLVIAREYGFTSWPRLVHYFESVERQRHHTSTRYISGGVKSYEGRVRWLLTDAAKRAEWTARTLASYVPRFYGLQPSDVFKETITEDDARLAVARMEGSSNWETLLERLAQGNGSAEKYQDWDVDPIRKAWEAMRAADLDALRRVVEANPDLLHPSPIDAAKGRSLLRSALAHERRHGRDALRPIVQWLTAQGLDLQRELNDALAGHPAMDSDELRYLLDRGADPDWIAPNGFSVLEHALLRYWDGAKIDVIAGRAAPRKGLWIAAGLGDIDGVRRFLDRDGCPTHEARRFRPDFDAIGPMTFPQHPDPSDEEILTEALFVAVLNGRVNVIEYMASRGASMNGLVMGMPSISTAVDRGNVAVVEALVRAGADVRLSGWTPGYSAQDILRSRVVSNSQDEKYRRMAAICGLDPSAILAEHDAKRTRPPGLAESLQAVFELAGDDAFRRDQADVRPENLLVGLLRSRAVPPSFFAQLSGVDGERFHADFVDRLRPADDRVARAKLPVSPDAQAALQRAITTADEMRRERVTGLHLLSGLAACADFADTLAEYGGSVEKLRERLEGTL